MAPDTPAGAPPAGPQPSSGGPAPSGAPGDPVSAYVRPPWPPWRTWEPLAAIAVLALSQVALGLGLHPALRRFGLGSAEQRLEIAFPILVLGSHAATWVAVLWLLWRHRLRLRAALALQQSPGRALWGVYGAGLGLYLLVLPLLALFPPPPDQTNLFTDIFRRGGPALATLLVTAVLLAPALEETLFRGLLLPALRLRWSFWPAALIVTVIFTGLHLGQTGPYWPALAGIFACGLALAWLLERSGSLWPSIAFHMGFNSTPFLVWLIAQPFGGLPDGPLR